MNCNIIMINSISSMYIYVHLDSRLNLSQGSFIHFAEFYRPHFITPFLQYVNYSEKSIVCHNVKRSSDANCKTPVSCFIKKEHSFSQISFTDRNIYFKSTNKLQKQKPKVQLPKNEYICIYIASTHQFIQQLHVEIIFA